MTLSKNAPLIAGISIPVLMIVFIAASIYLPALFMKPKYNFLYTTGSNDYPAPEYTVTDSKLGISCDDLYPALDTPAPVTLTSPEVKIKAPCTAQKAGKLYVHDVTANTSREISYEEAQQLTLDSNAKSEDGYEVVRGAHESDIFTAFFGGYGNSYNTRYLKGSKASKELHLQSNNEDRYSYYDLKFIGWVK